MSVEPPERLHVIGRASLRDRALDALTTPSVRGIVVVGRTGSGALEFADVVAAEVGRPTVIRADAASCRIDFGALAPFVEVDGHVDRDTEVDIDQLARVTAALIAACHDGAAPCVVDDATCLDAASALALLSAWNRGVPLVLVTGGSAKLPSPLATTATAFPIVDLVDLDDAAVSELAAATLEGSVEPRIIRSLTRLVGGASGAIIEQLAASVKDGTIVCSGGVWRQRSDLRIPPATLGRLDSLLAQLRPDQLDALDLVALGPRVPVDILERLVDHAALSSLEVQGLVSLIDASQGPFVEVAAPLVASCRLQEMGGLRRRRLARTLLDGMTEADYVVADIDPVIVASVRLAAGLELDIADAATAARGAHQQGELPLAIQFCEAIRSADRSTELTIMLSELLTEAGRNREAESMLRGVVAENDQERALVAMARAVNLGIHLDQVDEAIGVLDAANSDLSDGPWAAEVMGLRGVIELMLGRPGEALARVEPFLELGSGREFVEAATAAGPALVVLGRCEQAAGLAQASLAERIALGDQAFLESAGLHALIRGLGLSEAGRFDEADELTAFVLTAASDMAATNGVMWAGVVRGRSLLDQGRYPEAITLFELAASAALDLNLGLHLGWARGGALLAASQMGDAAAARRALDALDASPPTPLAMMASEVERARAWAMIALGDLRRGAVRLLAAADRAHASGEVGMEVLALHDLVRVGRSEQVDRLVALADRLEGPLNATRIAHGEAFAADDADALVEVADAFESLGALVLAAEAVNQASWVQRRRGAAIAAERLRSRVLSLRARRPSAVTPGLASHPGLASLTLREAEVASLVAAGRSSKEVAQDLGVSVRTIDNLLQRVYRKLGVGGRAGLRELSAG